MHTFQKKLFRLLGNCLRVHPLGFESEKFSCATLPAMVCRNRFASDLRRLEDVR